MTYLGPVVETSAVTAGTRTCAGVLAEPLRPEHAVNVIATNDSVTPIDERTMGGLLSRYNVTVDTIEICHSRLASTCRHQGQVRQKWNADDSMADLPLTESENANTADLDLLDTREMLRRINDEDGKVANAVALEIDVIATAVDAIAPRLRAGGRLHYFGAGTSGLLAVLNAAEIPPTFSAKDLVIGHIAGGSRALTDAVEAAEDDAAAGAAEVDRAGIAAHDAVIGISASGGAAYVMGAVQRARDAGALTIAIVNTPDSELAALVNIAIAVNTGPEVLAGSTRMKAATAQKLVLNSISTAVMVKLGKVHGNLMVDLRASNAKLRARALRLAMTLSGASSAVAKAALEGNEWHVKLAIVQIVAGATTPAQAAELLESAGGSLRAVLDRYPRQESHPLHRT